jgi:hypothetical protein
MNKIVLGGVLIILVSCVIVALAEVCTTAERDKWYNDCTVLRQCENNNQCNLECMNEANNWFNNGCDRNVKPKKK